MIALPSIAFEGFSGSAKGVTARRVGGRNILSVKSRPTGLTTNAQVVRRASMAKISKSWKQLTSDQMRDWGRFAEHASGASVLGKKAEISGLNLYIRLNVNRAMAGEPLMTNAPLHTMAVPNVEYEQVVVTPELMVIGGIRHQPDPFKLVVKMSNSQSAGISNGWSKTVIITPGMEDDWGEADVTKLYLKTIGVEPVPGEKVFVQTYWLDTSIGFAGGDHLDRWNLNHPRTGSVLKTNPPCRDAGRVFRVHVRTLWYLCVDKSRFNVTMLRYSRVLLFLIMAALSSCNQYNRILEDVYDNDQAAREWTKGMSSLSADEIVEYTTAMERVDSLNQATVFDILDKEGWPYHLSEKANRAIWIVIDHSDLAYRSKYLGLVKEKAEEGVLDKTDYAILNDRVRLEEGKPQIYGTQIKMAATIVDDDIAMQLCLWPVENPAALDSLRSTVGLSPIEEYLKTSSESIGQEIVWDKEKTVADFD